MARGLSALNTYIDDRILIGGRRTTAEKHREVEKEIAASSLNIIDGGNVLENLVGYFTELTPTHNQHLTPKKYVDDLIAAITSELDLFLPLDGSEEMTGDLGFRKGSTTKIGTNDNFDFLFETNDTERGGITNAGKWMIGVTSPFTDTYLSSKSQGNSSSTYHWQAKNADNTVLAFLRDDGLFEVKTKVRAGSTSTPTDTIPLEVDASSDHDTYLLALGKNENSAYFRVDKDGNITDIGGGPAKIQNSAGTPYFPDGFAASQWASAVDGNVKLRANVGGGNPWIFDASTSTTDNQVTLTVRHNDAATKGDIQQWMDKDSTILSQINKYGVWVPPSYTVATVPAASENTRGIIYITDQSGGPVLAFSDGTNWRTVTDRTIITT